jgi:hypothetical protein
MSDVEGDVVNGAPRAGGRHGRISRLSALTLAVVAAVLLGGAGLGVAAGRSGPAARGATSCGPSTSKVTVQGSGEATATPGLLTVVVQMSASGPSATTALASDNAKATAAVSALEFGGVLPKDIQTSGLSLQPQYVYPKGVPTLTGYQVTNTVTATLRDIAKSGAVLDGVVGVAGDALQIQSVSFSVADPSAVEDMARARAASQAISHAQALARAAGESLGALCSVTDQSPQAQQGASAGLEFAANAPTAAVPIEAGTQVQSAQVSVVYALTPATPGKKG